MPRYYLNKGGTKVRFTGSVGLNLGGGGGGVPGDGVFHSDWSTATGQTNAALNDTGKALPWTDNLQVGSSPQILTVVSASGRGFPASMTNCLRVEHAVIADGWWIEIDGGWSAPSIGNALYFRHYFRHEIADAAGVQGYAATHPLETEYGAVGLGANTLAQKFGSNTDGTYPWLFQVESASFPYSGWTPGGNQDGSGDPMYLQKNTTYRIEWKILRTATSTITLDMRIYGGDDSTLLFDKNNIYAWGGSGSDTLAAHGSGLPMDATHMTRLRVGKNGGFGAGAGQYVYWGGFAVRTADWCGSYNGTF